MFSKLIIYNFRCGNLIHLALQLTFHRLEFRYLIEIMRYLITSLLPFQGFRVCLLTSCSMTLYSRARKKCLSATEAVSSTYDFVVAQRQFLYSMELSAFMISLTYVNVWLQSDHRREVFTPRNTLIFYFCYSILMKTIYS